MVFDKIRSLLAEQFALEEDEITPETLIVDDLGADSLDIVDILSSIGDEYDIEIDDMQMENIRTVGDIVSFIEENM